MKRPNRSQLVLFLIALLPGLVTAAYRWVDKEGNVQFTQYPPPSDAQVEVEKIKTPKDPRPAKEEKKEEEVVGEPGDIKVEGPTEEEKAAERERKRKNCQAARANLAGLQSNPRIKMKGKDGQVGFVGDAKRAQMISQAKKQIQKYCR
jgi:hypothetical protein